MCLFFFVKQKTADEVRISDWSSDVCSSDLVLGASPIKQHLLHGVDMIVVRERTGGIYFGDKQRHADSASDLCAYSVAEIKRVVRSACRLARQRRGQIGRASCRERVCKYV